MNTSESTQSTYRLDRYERRLQKRMNTNEQIGRKWAFGRDIQVLGMSLSGGGPRLAGSRVRRHHPEPGSLLLSALRPVGQSQGQGQASRSVRAGLRSGLQARRLKKGVGSNMLTSLTIGGVPLPLFAEPAPCFVWWVSDHIF